jgi:hypothetical protein
MYGKCSPCGSRTRPFWPIVMDAGGTTHVVPFVDISKPVGAVITTSELMFVPVTTYVCCGQGIASVCMNPVSEGTDVCICASAPAAPSMSARSRAAMLKIGVRTIRMATANVVEMGVITHLIGF